MLDGVDDLSGEISHALTLTAIRGSSTGDTMKETKTVSGTPEARAAT